jgi:uncharacterized protein
LTVRSSYAGRIVVASCNRARTVVVLFLLVVTLAVVYTGQHFAMTTDSLELISADLPWRKNKANFEKAFPQLSDLIVVVVDGATPELAEKSTAKLSALLASQVDLFRSVRQPEGGFFFDHNGLLFLPLSTVEAVTTRLISAQPFLGPVAADPSLRGVTNSLSIALEGVQEGHATLEDIRVPMRTFADALEAVLDEKAVFFSWEALMSGQSDTRETRRFIIVQPALNHEKLAPGARAADAIRQLATNAGLDRASGVRVRLTGPVVLADEEFSSLTEHVAVMAAATVVTVLLMLWLAVRSVYMMASIVISTLTGLILTTALGLLAFGRFNLISVAFIPVFVGLGVDFAIQFTVRFRREHVAHADMKTALAVTGGAVGHSLALAAAAIAAGFFAFLPTNYVGASELGLIAGVGMAVAFFVSLTLLPALLLVMAAPRGAPASVGLPVLAPLDEYLARHRRIVLGTAASSAAVSLALLPFLHFDFNPLHIKNPKVESVSALMDLMSDSDRTPNTIDVLASSLTKADEIAQNLSRLPEVARTVTLTSFIPQQQAEKLELIGDAAMLLDLTLNPPHIAASPTDTDVTESLRRMAADLRSTDVSSASGAANDAVRLAAVLTELAAPPASGLRARAAMTLIAPLDVLLGQFSAMLHPEPVTLETLPSDLVEDWVAKDGRARIQVFPTGNSNDNETLQRFASAVRAVAPNATGTPIAMQEAARVVVDAFIEAGLLSFFVVVGLLAVALHRVRDVMMALTPILLSCLLTLVSCILMDQPLNFANIIALPLLFGIGVAFSIYFVVAWRAGATNLLGSSLGRAVVCSALTTAGSFAGLCFSSHPGTASLGVLLMTSLGWTLITVLLFEPALLGPPPGTMNP